METHLSLLRPGDEAIVQRIEGSGELRFRLLEMGIVKGTKIILNRIAPLGDPLEITVEGYRLSMRREEAAFIIIKKITKPKK